MGETGLHYFKAIAREYSKARTIAEFKATGSNFSVYNGKNLIDDIKRVSAGANFRDFEGLLGNVAEVLFYNAAVETNTFPNLKLHGANEFAVPFYGADTPEGLIFQITTNASKARSSSSKLWINPEILEPMALSILTRYNVRNRYTPRGLMLNIAHENKIHLEESPMPATATKVCLMRFLSIYF